MKLHYLPILALALGAPSFSAANDPFSPGPPAPPAPPEPYELPFSIRTDEPMPLRSFIEVVQDVQLKGEPLNVIVTEAAGDVVIPPINLRKVSLVKILETLVPFTGLVMNDNEADSSATSGILIVDVDNRGGDPTAAKPAAAVATNTVQLSPPKITFAKSLAGLDGESAAVHGERLSKLILATWTKQGVDASSATVTYDGDTGILVIYATDWDMSTAQSIMEAYENSILEKANTPQPY